MSVVRFTWWNLPELPEGVPTPDDEEIEKSASALNSVFGFLMTPALLCAAAVARAIGKSVPAVPGGVAVVAVGLLILSCFFGMVRTPKRSSRVPKDQAEAFRRKQATIIDYKEEWRLVAVVMAPVSFATVAWVTALTT